MASEPDSPIDRLSEIFDAVLASPPADREARLDELCRQDASVREQVRRLLQAHEASDSLLDSSDVERLAGELPEISTSDVDESLVGLQFGRYRILAVLASGGMGTVYEATQENPHRRIALKVLKGDDSTDAAVRRFDQEAQILAMLRHPGIAQIYETGLQPHGDTELPYFAMELVHGRRLDEHCRGLDRREMLEIFARVCDAVQHAHQKGVIHRDIKPANILVESGGQPKVLDFGISSSPLAGLESGDVLPDAGRLSGTLPYMSPEQTRGDWTELDVRSDVYSLGALLFQLLTGQLPFDPRRHDGTELLRLIREGTPTPLASIDRSTRGDLEAIAHKCLARDRAERYASAGELATDVRKHLNEEPVAARGTSSAYRTWKLASRNRFTLVGSVLLCVLATTVIVQTVLLLGKRDDAPSGPDKTASDSAEVAALRADRAALRYLAGIARAKSAVLEQRLFDARAHLEAQPTEKRGWEWSYLTAELDRSTATPISGLLNAWGLAISSDGRYIASSDEAGTLIVYDTTKNRTTWRLPNAHPREFRTLAFGPDGELITGSRQEGMAKLWSIRERRVVAKLEGHRFGITNVSYSNDANRIATSSLDRTVRVWRRGRFDEPDLVLRHPRAVWDASFFPDGVRLLTSCQDNQARIWNLEMQRVEALIPVMPRGRVANSRHAWAARVSPDGKSFATTSHDGEVKIWDTESQELKHVLRGHAGRVHSVAFRHDSEVIVTGGVDGVARLWGVQSGRELGRFMGHPVPIHAVRFLPDSPDFASASTDGTVKLWSALQANGPRRLAGHTGELSKIAILPDGRRVVTVSGEGEILVWDALKSEITGRMKCPPAVLSISIDSTGKRLVTASKGQAIHVWDLTEGKLEDQIGDGPQFASSAVCHPREPWVATGWNDGMIRVWDIDSGKEIEVFRAHDAAIRSLAFDSSGGQLASGSVNGEVAIRDRAGGSFLHRFRTELSLPWALRFSPDNSVLAAARGAGTIDIWDTASGQRRQTLRGHTSQVFAVSFSPDGTRLLSASQDRRPRIWDWRRGETLLVLDDVSGWCWDAAFSNDGVRVFAVSTDKGVRLWNANR